MNISPCKLIQEPQMRSCSSHLSNKNVLSYFRKESKLKDGSFILAGSSFQIVGPQTDLEWPRSKCHCSGSWNVQLPWGGRSQLSPIRGKFKSSRRHCHSHRHYRHRRRRHHRHHHQHRRIHRIQRHIAGFIADVALIIIFNNILWSLSSPPSPA